MLQYGLAGVCARLIGFVQDLQVVGAGIHTCYHVAPYEGHVRLGERLNADTPGDRDKKTMPEHPPNEGGVVISGEIEVTAGDPTSILNVGDARLFTSREPHRFRTIGDRPAVVTSACRPPYL